MSQEIFNTIEQETGNWPMGIEEARQLREEVEEERACRVSFVNSSYSEMYIFDDDPFTALARPFDPAIDYAREGYGKPLQPIEPGR
jgi:hypothetical protein